MCSLGLWPYAVTVAWWTAGDHPFRVDWNNSPRAFGCVVRHTTGFFNQSLLKLTTNSRTVGGTTTPHTTPSNRRCEETLKNVQRCTYKFSQGNAYHNVVYNVPCKTKGCMVNALVSRSDEGRVMAAISFGEVPNNLWPENVRMGKPSCFQQESLYEDAYLGKWNISVPRGIESNIRNFLSEQMLSIAFRIYSERLVRKLHYVQEEGSCDSLSSGERNGNSPNHTYLYVWGCRAEFAFSCEELQSWYIGKRVGKRDPRR